EVARAVFDEHVELLERALVEQQFESLARRELAALVLRLDTALAAAHARVGAPRLELFENVLHRASNPASRVPQQIPIMAPGRRKRAGDACAGGRACPFGVRLHPTRPSGASHQLGEIMGQINWTRVVLGGVVAAVILFIAGFIIHGLILGPDWMAWGAAGHMPL